MTTHTVRVLIAAALGLAAMPSGARADTCDAARIKAIAKLEAAYLGCDAKAAKTGNHSALPACQSKAASKFAAAFAKAATCDGDQASCEATALACRAAVVSAIDEPLPSKCVGTKRTAAAKLIQAQLACFAKSAQRDTPVDPVCLSKAVAKFEAARAKAGACPDGGDPASLTESECITPAVDVAGDVAIGACPVPTTTTTTSTSTTTLPPMCREDGDKTACLAFKNDASCQACCETKGCRPICLDAAVLYSCDLLADDCASEINYWGCAAECCG